MKAGGFIALEHSAGLAAGDAGSRLHLAVNAKLKKQGKPFKGHATLTFRRTHQESVRHYEIRATSVTTLIANPTTGMGTLIAQARVDDITRRPRLIASSATLHITVDDNGTPGAHSDRVGVTVWNSNGELWFSSHWDGRDRRRAVGRRQRDGQVRGSTWQPR